VFYQSSLTEISSNFTRKIHVYIIHKPDILCMDNGEYQMLFFCPLVALAAMIPNLGAVISLVGAVSSSTLALIFPPIIEIVTFWHKGFGKHSWILWKDIFIMIFGLLGFIFGSYVSIWNIIQPETE